MSETTTAEVGYDDLPPTQYLIMEVLAARARLGEHSWTFPSRLRSAVGALSDRGLVVEMHGVVEHTCRAYLTDAGREAALWDDYTPQAARIIAELINADRAFRWAMYNSDSEASWTEERKRWDAAEKTALDAYPGVAGLLEND